MPNVCIAKWGTHNSIRLFLPELFSTDRKSPFLTQDELAVLYEKGIRPAAERVLDHQAAEWPVTYKDEMFRARSRNGQLAFQTKIIPKVFTDIWAEYLVDFLKCDTDGWGHGILFLHQIRGVKHSSNHNPNSSTVEQEFNNFLNSNHLNLVADLFPDQGCWWIDVGIEIASNTQRCLAWRTDSHYKIVKTICDLSHQVAVRITSPGSSKYTRDMLAHLPGVSGCRISPGVRGQGPHGVKYVQLYTTEKSITYHPERGHYGKFITCIDIIRGKDMAFIDQLYSLYRNAIGTCYSLARLELRVPFSSASDILVDLDEDLLCHSLLSFPPKVIWSVFSLSLLPFFSVGFRQLRAIRALAVKFVLEWQATARPELRAEPRAIVLTAGCCWLLNGLHSAPDQGASSKALMDRILPHITRAGADPDILAHGSPVDDDDLLPISDDEEHGHRSRRASSAETAPSYPYGLVFFRRIDVGPNCPLPNLGKGTPELPDNAFFFFFRSSKVDIYLDLTSSVLVKPTNSLRTQNKSQRTKMYINEGQNPPTNDFNLEARGIRCASPVYYEDESGANDGDDHVNPRTVNVSDPSDPIDVKLTKIWRQFLLDVTSKAPNFRDGARPSYCKLSLAERMVVNQKTYQNSMLSDYFLDCQWKVVENKDWQLIFDRLFPKIGKDLIGKVQNYMSTRYYPAWIALRDAETPEVFNACRKEIKKSFDQLFWMPFAQTDRIWHSRYMASFQRPPPLNRQVPSPLIYINGFSPRWNSRDEGATLVLERE